MKLLIDSTELNLLLSDRKKYIGNDNLYGIDKLFTGLTFAVPSIFAEYPDIQLISGESIKTILVIVGFLYAGWGVVQMISKVVKRYSSDDLLNEISNLNEITHPFSIVAIKDTFNQYPNKFLLYYDERWDCKFFFSYRTVDDDIKNIISRLSNELKISRDSISAEFVTEEIYKKHSVSDNIDKVYDHKIYFANIAQFTDELKATSFTIDGKKFFWMTIQEMERDPDIQEKNLDVVNLVKSNIP